MDEERGGSVMRDCDREELLCTCVDWGKDDLAARIHQSVVDAANQAESKHRQVEAVGKLVDASTAKNEEDV